MDNEKLSGLSENAVNVKPLNNTRIKIVTKNRQYIKDLKSHFSDYTPGFQYMPQYRSGGWDGKTYLFSNDTSSLPYGLLLDLVRFHKNNYSEYKISISEEVVNIFKNPYKMKPIYSLKYYPYDYQKDCIEEIIKKTKGIIRVATGGGKSLIITYIVKTINESIKDNRNIIIVPTKSLVRQFKDDMVDYGFKGEAIGEVYSSKKEWDNKITITTWQSLKNNKDKLNNYKTLIVDETHSAKGIELRKILRNASSPLFRIGTTGTMPENRLDEMIVRGYLGPV